MKFENTVSELNQEEKIIKKLPNKLTESVRSRYNRVLNTSV